MSRCSRAFAAAAVLVTLALGAQAAVAQSLAEVARQEANRRQQVQPGRVYTNGDLAANDWPTPSTPSSAAPPQESASTGEKDAPATDKKPNDAETPETPAGLLLKPRETRPEPYWRANARTLRADLAKAEQDVTQAETRLKALEAAPQTPAIARERSILAKAVAEFQQTLRYRRDAVSRFEAFAELHKVPADWIR
jgi:hypothetical protein